MSRQTQCTLTCPSCGREQEFIAWDSLNVTLDPEARGQLLRGELTRFRCAHCGWSGDVLYPLLYHDMEQRLMIYLLPEGGDLGPIPAPPFAPMQDYRFRRVRTRNELREKILLFDAGLDDRLLECLKHTLRVQMARRGQPLTGELLFAGMADPVDGKSVIGLVHLTEQGEEALELPAECLAQFSPFFTGPASPATVETGPWLEVDADFARAVLGSMREDGPPASGSPGEAVQDGPPS